MKAASAVIVSVSICVGCASSWAYAKDVTDENGEPWKLVQCSYSGMCVQRASETCPKGYR